MVWLDREITYGFFLQFIDNTDLAGQYLDQSFVLNLLRLFDFEEPIYRANLGLTIHKIYRNFLHLRAPILRGINNMFFQVFYEVDRHSVIADLLQTFDAIFDQLLPPLEGESQRLFKRIVIPLHKFSSLKTYYPQLAYCTAKFIRKDAMLCEELIRGLLRYWPKGDEERETMFLIEIEETVCVMSPEGFHNIRMSLFQ